MAVLAIIGALIVASCDSGGGDGVSSDSSSVQGYVNSYAAGGAMIQFTHPKEGLAKVFEAVVNAVFRPVLAAVAGVHVSVAGTDLDSTTADDGLFVISGVPPGEQQLVFSLGGSSATYALNVPPNSTISLNNIDVGGGGNVNAGSVSVVENPTDENDNTTPSDNVVTDNTPSDNTPSDNTPTDNTPTDNTPTDNTPTDNTSTNSVPSDNSTDNI